MRLAFILIAVAVLYGVYAVFGTRIGNAVSLRAAEQARAAGDAGRAADLYARVLGGTPRDEELRLLVCDLYREAGSFTRAEHTLITGLNSVGPSVTLYKKLCAVYVEQDKLLDAVELLDGVRSPDARDKLDAARPAPPSFTIPAGTYEERIEAGLSAGAGCTVYVSWTGGVPSVSRDVYTGAAALEPGATRARAVAVDPEGLVSVWAEGLYTLVNIVDPVVFADAEVEKCIRRTLEKPSERIYTADLWNITELVSEEPAAYGTLDDLAFCKNLRTLRLVGERGRCDVSGLALLEELEELSLASFGLNSMDLEWIGQIKSLSRLYLHGNGIGSPEPLAPLEGLTELDLSANSLLNIEPIARLGSLQVLNVSQNAVQDLAGLSPLKNLRVLLASENGVTALLGVGGLTALRELDVSYNSRLTSLSGIGELASLASVSAAHCRLEQLPKLSGLKSLEELNIGFNRLSGLDGMEGLVSLKTLACNDNGIMSLEPLSGCAALETLDASKNALSSVEPLKGLPSLQIVRVEYNVLKTLLPLKECPALEKIFAFGNSLTDPPNAFAGTGIVVS
ncbi:MAG: tetratricopeptide repeat protein [Oscillospiraceae bacterium]|nr:tetratricopeptide repeat protein [Oscillospiraceae bacterium]